MHQNFMPGGFLFIVDCSEITQIITRNNQKMEWMIMDPLCFMVLFQCFITCVAKHYLQALIMISFP